MFFFVFFLFVFFTKKFNVRLPNLIYLQNYCIRASFSENSTQPGNSDPLPTRQKWLARLSHLLRL